MPGGTHRGVPTAPGTFFQKKTDPPIEFAVPNDNDTVSHLEIRPQVWRRELRLWEIGVVERELFRRLGAVPISTTGCERSIKIKLRIEKKV